MLRALSKVLVAKARKWLSPTTIMSMSSSRMRMKSSRKILKKLSTTNIIVIENLDKDYDMDL